MAKKRKGFKYFTPKPKPIFWVSLRTGNKFPYSEYINSGNSELKQGKKDLPKSEYPYTFEYEKKKEYYTEFRSLEEILAKKKKPR